MSPKTTRDVGDAGFTLIELLTVVVIVAVLAGLSFVMIKGVKTRTALATSVVNVRNLQLANLQYSADQRGAYVAVVAWDNKGTQLASWCNNVDFRAYFEVPAPPASWPASMVSPYATLLDDNGNVDMTRSYGYNSTTLVATWGTPNTKAQAMRNTVSAPSQTLAFADALDWQISIWGSDRYTGQEVYTTSAPAFRYNGQAAVAYFDGRAGVLKRAEVVNNQSLWNIFR